MSSTNNIKAGDAVTLKSGGKRWTVTRVGDDAGTPSAWCVDDTGKKAVFPLVALDKPKKVKIGVTWLGKK